MMTHFLLGITYVFKLNTAEEDEISLILLIAENTQKCEILIEKSNRIQLSRDHVDLRFNRHHFQILH